MRVIAGSSIGIIFSSESSDEELKKFLLVAIHNHCQNFRKIHLQIHIPKYHSRDLQFRLITVFYCAQQT